jgi:hypothetical protein
MNFKYKSYSQKVLSYLPKGEIINYFFQGHVTKNLPLSKQGFIDKVNHSALAHYNNFKEFNKLDANSMQYYEFGAGWDLINPITFGLLGFELKCIDIRKLIIPQLVNQTIQMFISLREQLNFSYKEINEKNTYKNILDRLRNEFQLCYIAPLDARNTNFNTNSIDFISSTAVLEHISEKDIYPILNECYRILKPGGILSTDTDYRDHYSYFDKSISVYNFLKYSKKEWQKFNSSLHYQNRLRHSDYLKIISKTDFKIVKEIITKPSELDLDIINKLKISDEYNNYNVNDLGIKSSWIVLMK